MGPVVKDSAHEEMWYTIMAEQEGTRMYVSKSHLGVSDMRPESAHVQ
jgi:hypothetical protein